MTTTSDVMVSNFETYFVELCKNNSMQTSEMKLISSKYKNMHKELLLELPSVKSSGKIQINDMDLLSNKIKQHLDDSNSIIRRELLNLHKDLF